MSGSVRNLREAARRFLMEEHTASLATVDAQGRVHAANVWVAADARLRLYFISDPSSAHAQHIGCNPRVALTIGVNTSDPMRIQGLQMHGVCRIVAPPPEGKMRAWNAALRVYLRRFPQVAASEVLSELLQKQCFFCVAPRWIRWLDNTRGFGFKVEKEWSGG